MGRTMELGQIIKQQHPAENPNQDQIGLAESPTSSFQGRAVKQTRTPAADLQPTTHASTRSASCCATQTASTPPPSTRSFRPRGWTSSKRDRVPRMNAHRERITTTRRTAMCHRVLITRPGPSVTVL